MLVTKSFTILSMKKKAELDGWRMGREISMIEDFFPRFISSNRLLRLELIFDTYLAADKPVS